MGWGWYGVTYAVEVLPRDFAIGLASDLLGVGVGGYVDEVDGLDLRGQREGHDEDGDSEGQHCGRY